MKIKPVTIGELVLKPLLDVMADVLLFLYL